MYNTFLVQDENMHISFYFLEKCKIKSLFRQGKYIRVYIYLRIVLLLIMTASSEKLKVFHSQMAVGAVVVLGPLYHEYS